MALALPLEEWSVKVSDGPPDDPEDDLDAPVWAGVLPIVTTYGDPVPAPALRGDPAPYAWPWKYSGIGTWTNWSLGSGATSDASRLSTGSSSVLGCLSTLLL